MYKRSELRYVCYRAKKGPLQSEDHKKIASLIEKELSYGQNWSNFTVHWDLLVDRSGKIRIIKPEHDYNFIHSTLLEASVYVKNKIDFDSFNDRQLNIINQVDAIMLENIMTWSNYNVVWGIELDTEKKQIKTRLYNVKPNQIAVTEEMIEASKKNADGSEFTEESKVKETVLEAKPMTKEQQEQFESFLKRKELK